jgi:hypothetical protein
MQGRVTALRVSAGTERQDSRRPGREGTPNILTEAWISSVQV